MSLQILKKRIKLVFKIRIYTDMSHNVSEEKNVRVYRGNAVGKTMNLLLMDKNLKFLKDRFQEKERAFQNETPSLFSVLIEV